MYNKLGFNKLNNVFHNCLLFIEFIHHAHQQFLVSTCVNKKMCTPHDYGQLSLFVISTAFSFCMCDHVSIAYLNTCVDVD